MLPDRAQPPGALALAYAAAVASGVMARKGTAVGELRFRPRATTWQRWSGRRWAEPAGTVAPDLLRRPEPFPDGARVPTAERERVLAMTVQQEVLDGADVVEQAPQRATLEYVRPVSHVGHAIASLLTGGLWLPVWLAMCLVRRRERVQLWPDEWGHVWRVDPVRR